MEQLQSPHRRYAKDSHVYMNHTDCLQLPHSVAQAPQQPTEKGPPPAAAPGPTSSIGSMAMPEALLSQGM